jgi:hypothetical protein
MFSRLRVMVPVLIVTALAGSTSAIALRCRCECVRLPHAAPVCRQVCYAPRYVAPPGPLYLPPQRYFQPPGPRLVGPLPQYSPPPPPRRYVAPPPVAASTEPLSQPFWMVVYGGLGVGVLWLASHFHNLARLRNETAEIDRRAREAAPLRAKLEAAAAEADDFIDRERRRAFRSGRGFG